MQLELFPGYALTSVEAGIEIAEVNNNQFEVLLYAANNAAERDLVFRVNSPESNVIFSHVNPDTPINVYIDGDVIINGNLSITGELSVEGEIEYIGQQYEHSVTYCFNGLEIVYDMKSNLIYANGKETRNSAELGKLLINALRKNQDDLTFNDTKDFFNY